MNTFELETASKPSLQYLRSDLELTFAIITLFSVGQEATHICNTDRSKIKVPTRPDCITMVLIYYLVVKVYIHFDIPETALTLDIYKADKMSSYLAICR